MKKKKRFSFKHHHGLLLLAIILTLIGTIFVFESSVAEAFNQFNNPYHFVTQQLKWFAVGSVCMLLAYLIPPKLWLKTAPLLYILSLLSLLLVFIPGLGVKVNGAYRWINLGPARIQPVEFLKFGMSVFFASWMSKHQRLLPFMFLTVVPVILLLLQPDLGSSLIIITIAFGIFFLAGGNVFHMLGLGSIGLVGIILLILTQPYRLKRLTTFINPESDPLGASFHIRQITIALGNGAWLGQGIGKSKQKYSYIPEASSDSIFAIVAEEIGFVGSMFIFGLLLLFTYLGYKIMIQQKEKSFEHLLAGGILVWFSVQIALNLAAVTALVPLTGLPLPFFSYGGSSLVMILFATGILAAIGRTTKKHL